MPRTAALAADVKHGIRFRLRATATELVSFAYSPVLEAALSLHVIAGPKHHALQHGWVRRVRRLPVGLRRRVEAFRFAALTDVPDFLLPSSDGVFLSFAEELERLRALEPELVAFEFLRPMVDHGGNRDPELLSDPRVRQLVERRSANLGGDPSLARLIFDDPAELQDRFAALLSDYWEAAFEQEWNRLEPRLAAAVTEAGAWIAADGIYSLLTRFAPRLEVDRERELFGLDLPHDHLVEITAENKLSLVLSAYVWPHVRINCDAPFPLSVVIPAPFLAREARPQIADSELLQLLRAVGEETRLRALRLLAEAPRSTRELAPLLDISEAGLSKHLRLLADAGVLESHREGYYIVYELVPARLAQLSRTLSDYVSGD
jgi:DNA-binding transcriptional ArsR family regulator